MRHLRSIFSLVLVLAISPLVAAESYVIDRTHSHAGFKVGHLMSTVSGKFTNFSGALSVDKANPAKSSVELTIQTTSISTDDPDRDRHLRSSDFFDVERFPTITFKSTSVAPSKKKDMYDVTGDLTMHGVTKRVVLPVSVLGFGKDNDGVDRGGFEVATVLDRRDYGISWNKTVDPGFLLSYDVKIAFDIEAVRK